MHVTIAPASTKTGAAIIRSLLSFGDQSINVKALYRNVKKAPEEFTSHDNFTAVEADVSDASSLDFSGSDAVLAITPPVYDGRDIVAHATNVSKNVCDAVEKAGTVKRLVLLSSVGAEFSEGTVGVNSCHSQSQLTFAGRTQDKPHCRASLQGYECSRDHLCSMHVFYGELDNVRGDPQDTKALLLLNNHALGL